MADSIDDTHAGLTGWANPVTRLRQAIEREHFVLYAQGILALGGSERYPMAEVLVRMRDEENALLPPGDFFPAFEHYKMMPQLDRWVTRSAAQQLARRAPVRRLTLNISGQTLEDAAFPAAVADALSAAAIAAERLVFEVDEADTLARPEAAERFAQAIHALGCKVAVDGFGRRSVSFSAVKAMRADFVKVDGGIVRKLAASGIARTKMNAVLRVAQTLRYGVVAEFVEDAGVLERLRALGVGYAQGFGIHQPQAYEALTLPG